VRGVRGVRQPWRVVLTRSGNLPSSAHLFTDEHRDRTLVYKKRSLARVLRDLGRRGVTSVLIEGGAQILGEAFDRRLVDRVQFYIAPLLLGGPKLAVAGRGIASPEIANAQYRRIGSDLVLTGDIRHGSLI
jgi:diaminohydroxyphosphoribosylaminopyrimidine deaminase/5-amino-6-(5-phosphoribosylamino)uracil reductase